MTSGYVIHKPSPRLLIGANLFSFGLGICSGANFFIWASTGHFDAFFDGALALLAAVAALIIISRIGVLYVINDEGTLTIIKRSLRRIAAVTTYHIGSEAHFVMRDDKRNKAFVIMSVQLTSAKSSLQVGRKLGRYNRKTIPEELMKLVFPENETGGKANI
jgi:hypothetical protein